MRAGGSKRSPLLKAFLASWAVYLMPIIGPHAFWLLGEHLSLRLVRGGPDRVAAWIALEWGLAIGLQVMAGALWYWFLARPKWWRVLSLMACVPVFFMVTEWAYLVAIPSRFLIEQDTASESGDWKSVCVVADTTLAPVQSPPDLLVARAGQTWLAGTGINSFILLEMPGCRTTPVESHNSGPSSTQPYVVPGGASVFNTWDNRLGQNHWWYRDAIDRAPQPLPRPPADLNRSAPILSTDGRWAAWLEYVPGVTVTPLPQRVVIRALHDDREHVVNLPPPGSFEWVLRGVNMETEELTLYAHEYATRQSSLVVFGLDGARRGPPLVATGVAAQATTFLRVGPGWVAWDAYREDAPYRVAWSLPSGHHTHQVLKGRGITAVAVSPNSAYVTLSTTTTLNIGHIKDAVYVLRASDGQEVWRRYLPAYTRSSVAFLGNGYFAYTDWDGSHTTVRVLQIPD
jgi:hypothetical protein